MQPIGPLMHEHRLIERLLHLVEREVREVEAGSRPDSAFLDQAVDFSKSVVFWERAAFFRRSKSFSSACASLYCC